MLMLRNHIILYTIQLLRCLELSPQYDSHFHNMILFTIKSGETRNNR